MINRKIMLKVSKASRFYVDDLYFVKEILKYVVAEKKQNTIYWVPNQCAMKNLLVKAERQNNDNLVTKN